jgi:hypothetical protein
MKCHIYLAILLAGCLLVAPTAFATPTSNDPNFSVSLLASGLNGPSNADVFRSATGDLLVSEFSANRVTLVNATTGATSFFATQTAPDEIAVRSSDGIVAVKTHPDGPITFYNSTGVFQGSIASLTPSACITGLAFDASGNLFVAADGAGCGSGSIYQFSGATPWTSPYSTVVTGLDPLEGMTFSAGNLFAISFTSGKVYKIPVPGFTPTTTMTTVPSTTDPSGIAVDPLTGDVYVSEFTGPNILKVPAAGGSFSTFATGFSNSLGLGFDTAGTLYVNEFNTGNVWRFTRGQGQSTLLTFAPGQNSSATATFNCTSQTTPCPDPDAHSIKFTVGTVSSQFSILVTATEVTGDGICLSGIPDDPADPIDCRFVRFFGQPIFNPPLAGPNPNTKVPFCYPYSHSKCVVYKVTGDPPPGPGTYSNGVVFKIAWNNVSSPPPGWLNSPRMYDDPSDDADGVHYPTITPTPPTNPNGFPYAPEDNQFVFDVTTFFDPTPGGVGMDPITGKGGTFNDFTVAFPSTFAAVQQPINSDGSSIFTAKRGVIPVKFTYAVDGVATCNLPAATISLKQLSGAAAGNVDENTYLLPADNGASFRISGCQYIYNLDGKSLGVGTYKVGIAVNGQVVGIAYFALK